MGRMGVVCTAQGALSRPGQSIPMGGSSGRDCGQDVGGQEGGSAECWGEEVAGKQISSQKVSSELADAGRALCSEKELGSSSVRSSPAPDCMTSGKSWTFFGPQFPLL